MSFDPFQPYGPPVASTMRVVTWNVWGRYGNWAERQAALEVVLAESRPDLVCLVESWSVTEDNQPERVASRLGMEHSLFVGDLDSDGWTSGIGLASRWPVVRHETRELRGDAGGAAGAVLFAEIGGPRGPIQVFVVMLDYPLDAS